MTNKNEKKWYTKAAISGLVFVSTFLLGGAMIIFAGLESDFSSTAKNGKLSATTWDSVLRHIDSLDSNIKNLENDINLLKKNINNLSGSTDSSGGVGVVVAQNTIKSTTSSAATKTQDLGQYSFCALSEIHIKDNDKSNTKVENGGCKIYKDGNNWKMTLTAAGGENQVQCSAVCM